MNRLVFILLLLSPVASAHMAGATTSGQEPPAEATVPVTDGNTKVAAPDNTISVEGAGMGDEFTHPIFKKKRSSLTRFRKWVMENMEYPSAAAAWEIEGRVVASFVVGKDGSLEDIYIEEYDNLLLSQAVYRTLLNSPEWTPGKDANGNPVRVRYYMPVNFELKDTEPRVGNTDRPGSFAVGRTR